jgi:hypothetical protein|tara:strand:+ start:1475 stop:1786 length:312 start_codon:yes stop_codon:yes gene_type:complete
MTTQRRNQIEKRIEKIKSEIAEIGEMRPGSLTQQYKDRQRESGPFYQLSYTHEMKSRTNYIRKEFVSMVRQQIKNYKRFKKLTTEWVALGIEHSKLSMKLKKD